MGEDWSLICSRHKEDTLSYLTVKTAAVRCGLKPGELLRVPLCGHCRRPGGPAIRSVLSHLGLPYRLLETAPDAVLTLFYHPAKLAETLTSRSPKPSARPGLSRTHRDRGGFDLLVGAVAEGSGP